MTGVDFYALDYIQDIPSRVTMFQLNISVLILTAILVLIAFRQVGGIKIHIWQIMLLVALTVLLTGQISPYDGLMSINPDIENETLTFLDFARVSHPPYHPQYNSLHDLPLG